MGLPCVFSYLFKNDILHYRNLLYMEGVSLTWKHCIIYILYFTKTLHQDHKRQKTTGPLLCRQTLYIGWEQLVGALSTTGITIQPTLHAYACVANNMLYCFADHIWCHISLLSLQTIWCHVSLLSLQTTWCHLLLLSLQQ